MVNTSAPPDLSSPPRSLAGHLVLILGALGRRFERLTCPVKSFFVRSFLASTLWVLSLLLLASCTSFVGPQVKADPCSNVDWFEVGRLDALVGAPAETSLALQRCQSTAPDKVTPNAMEFYVAGWNRGLISYCTPEHAFNEGRRQREYQQICPAHVERAFLERYEAGRQLSRLERESEANERKIEILANEIRALESPGILDDALRRTGQLPKRSSTGRGRLDEMRRELAELKNRNATLNAEIRRLEL